MKKHTEKFFYVVLFLFWMGCGDSESPVQPDPDPPEADPAEPVNLVPPEAFFTEPEAIEEGRTSTVILDKLVKLIDAVPEDESIYISIYQFEYGPLLEALERAHSRNVKLYVMLDMSNRSDNTGTANRLTVLGENVEIVRIHNDASASAINHNKFVLFPEINTEEGTADHILFQTSQNFKEAGARKIQDGIILSDESLYEAYLDYWEAMQALAAEEMSNFEYREYSDPAKGVTAYFHPKRKDGATYGSDTVVEILDDIEDPSSAIIRIGMSAWTDSRNIILEELEELLAQGAEIEVVAKSSIGSETYNGLEDLAENGAVIKIYNMANSGQPKINIHSKFMMIEGVWQGQETNLLLTGTQNFTMNALRNNNEATLLLRDHEFYDSYKAYFEELKTLPVTCCSVD